MRERYSRQILFCGIGEEGQRRINAGRVLIVGCGALGSAQVEALARAGVGHLRIVDRDFVEFSNLQRQTMFTEVDARERLPKAVACARRVKEVNSEIEVEAEIADVDRRNIEQLIAGCDAVIDGTDNFATRYLINDACVKHGVNWIYGAAVGSYGVTLTVRPRQTACLRCVFEITPPPGSAETCDTAGIIMPIISVVAAVQVTEALKLLTGQTKDLHNSLMQFDVWRNEWRRIKALKRAEDCPTCVLNRYESLDAQSGEATTLLCGRDAIQVSPAHRASVDLPALARRLHSVGQVQVNAYLLRVAIDNYELTIFRDARAIIRGTDDAATARILYAKYVGV